MDIHNLENDFFAPLANLKTGSKRSAEDGTGSFGACWRKKLDPFIITAFAGTPMRHSHECSEWRLFQPTGTVSKSGLEPDLAILKGRQADRLLWSLTSEEDATMDRGSRHESGKTYRPQLRRFWTSTTPSERLPGKT